MSYLDHRQSVEVSPEEAVQFEVANVTAYTRVLNARMLNCGIQKVCFRSTRMTSTATP